MQLMRFLVGRSAPTSLAVNQNPSEADVAKRELNDLQYKDSAIEQMLDVQTTPTFAEPIGWIARLVHSLSSGILPLDGQLGEEPA